MDSDRARGVLLGLACGDALGRPVEFAAASEIGKEHGQLDEMIGYGTWNQPAGTITDDTEQTLCIARSLVEQEGSIRLTLLSGLPRGMRVIRSTSGG